MQSIAHFLDGLTASTCPPTRRLDFPGFDAILDLTSELTTAKMIMFKEKIQVCFEGVGLS